MFSSRRRHTKYWRDWSSDVCSSDLHSQPWISPALLLLVSALIFTALNPDFARPGTLSLLVQQTAVIAALAIGQIGRASCRERVQISVVAVSLKKKHHYKQARQFSIT